MVPGRERPFGRSPADQADGVPNLMVGFINGRANFQDWGQGVCQFVPRASAERPVPCEAPSSSSKAGSHLDSTDLQSVCEAQSIPGMGSTPTGAMALGAKRLTQRSKLACRHASSPARTSPAALLVGRRRPGSSRSSGTCQTRKFGWFIAVVASRSRPEETWAILAAIFIRVFEISALRLREEHQQWSRKGLKLPI